MFRRLIKLFQGDRSADWKGRLHRRFVLHKLRFEWGRWCYKTDCCGDTRAVWWERDLKVEQEEREEADANRR